MAEVFANSEDPDQTPYSVAADLGLHCLPITLLQVSRLQWVNKSFLLPAYSMCLKIAGHHENMPI